jgi:antibiotic biosynthesis monooxygenase (ABM) superfamily enzyme
LNDQKPPSRHINTLVIYIGLLPLVYFIPPLILKFIDNRLGVTAISLALIVPVMSYFVLPTANKLISKIMVKK